MAMLNGFTLNRASAVIHATGIPIGFAHSSYIAIAADLTHTLLITPSEMDCNAVPPAVNASPTLNIMAGTLKMDTTRLFVRGNVVIGKGGILDLDVYN